MLTDNGILARRVNYMCCSVEQLARYVKAKQFGDTKCAAEARRMWLYLLWAQGVMARTNTSTETDGCVTNAFAEAVAKKADCFCSSCGCAPVDAPFPVVDTCTPTISHEVISAVPASDRPAIEAGPPTTGDAYLVISGTDSPWTTNTIQTWNGSGWDATAIVDGEVTLASTGIDLWTTLGGTNIPGLLYPTVTATFIGPPDIYEVVSDYPQIAAYTGRTARINIFGPGGWFTILTVPEADLVTPASFNITGYVMEAIQVMYVLGDCSWLSDVGTIGPEGCDFPRDHDCLDHDTSDHS